MTGPRDRRRRADRDLIAAAAEVARKEASRGQAEHAAGRGPIVPYERYVFVGLLDELSFPDYERAVAVLIGREGADWR